MQADQQYHWLIRGIAGAVSQLEMGLRDGADPGHALEADLDNVVDRLARIQQWVKGKTFDYPITQPTFDWKDIGLPPLKNPPPPEPEPEPQDEE